MHINFLDLAEVTRKTINIKNKNNDPHFAKIKKAKKRSQTINVDTKLIVKIENLENKLHIALDSRDTYYIIIFYERRVCRNVILEDLTIRHRDCRSSKKFVHVFSYERTFSFEA
ncbi:hypothetical protein PUN28_004391 [Cardiocondyla obscurior]|uniref:Uncharacterized protein n=1 Tax=Cardiocondyla obscurior TaxID=286306 RepID=A0AAW2GF96_9HYME